MGQYYTPVVTQNNKTILFGLRTALLTDEDRAEFKRNPYSNYHGAKIMEHSWWGNDLVNGVVKRLYNKKGRVAWVGDYTSDITDRVVSNDGTEAPLSPSELYSGGIYDRDENGKIKRDENGYNIITEQLPDNVKKMEVVRYNPNFKLDGKFLINLSKKEYLDLSAYKERSVTDDGWCVNPIPLLTSTGGDQGGGDYHEGLIDQNYVGTWAYDELIIKDTLPRYAKDFTPLNIIFNEEIKSTYKGLQ